MTARLAHIYRHPIKSVGYEEIRTAPLTEGRVLPLDRVWAIATEGAEFDEPLTGWAPKRNFLRGAVAPGLAAVRAQVLDEGGIELTHPDLWHLRIDPDRAEDRRKLIDWLLPLWPERQPAPRAVERPGVPLTDDSKPYVSLLSMDSLAALGAHFGRALTPPRFRGNLWVTGWEPWAERQMAGKTLRIGAAEIELVEPIGRCRATHANPETGEEDLKILAGLKALNGDTDFGMFGLVRKSGDITREDPVEIL